MPVKFKNPVEGELARHKPSAEAMKAIREAIMKKTKHSNSAPALDHAMEAIAACIAHYCCDASPGFVRPEKDAAAIRRLSRAVSRYERLQRSELEASPAERLEITMSSRSERWLKRGKRAVGANVPAFAFRQSDISAQFLELLYAREQAARRLLKEAQDKKSKTSGARARAFLGKIAFQWRSVAGSWPPYTDDPMLGMPKVIKLLRDAVDSVPGVKKERVKALSRTQLKLALEEANKAFVEPDEPV